ncbi:hypothetical protein FF86_101980 [Frankia sp. CpI1-P]|nr:hypothetical protein FF86_101980 [Frankia sp. CpI1-P]
MGHSLGPGYGDVVGLHLSMDRFPVSDTTAFARAQIEILARSGWNTCESVREGTERAGLPVPSAEYLRDAFTPDQWDRARRATVALSTHFADARFADAAVYGILLVPDPGRLDTRGGLDPAVRRDQTGSDAGDVVDRALPAGEVAVEPGVPWTMVATITGAAGIHLGSYNDIVNGPEAAYTVAGVDTRRLMVRQIWGARVLQSGAQLPDCEQAGHWTFTLLPGEPMVKGRAVSGTVLYNRVRFRLGSPSRGIAVVRACPALVIS